MKVACISASNTVSTGDNSASVMVCNKIKEIIMKEKPKEIVIDILPLRDYSVKPCILCGCCSKNGRCIYDDAFNQVLAVLEQADGVFLVVPHYSPIPAKLLMIFEKINEIMYAGWINDTAYRSPLSGKPVGIIGHGGMVGNEDNLKYYHDHLVSPVAATLRSLSFHVVKLNDEFPNGAVFGLKDETCLIKSDRSIFPDIIQDWPTIEKRIEPLILNVIREISDRCLR